MEDFKCRCRKIVCQIDHRTIIIKCRHCKRYVHINTGGISGIEFRLDPDENRGFNRALKQIVVDCEPKLDYNNM